MPSPPMSHDDAPAVTTTRAEEWAATMGGHRLPGTPADPAAPAARRAHEGELTEVGRIRPATRLVREERERALLAPGATYAEGAGRRALAEEPDPWRTCFE